MEKKRGRKSAAQELTPNVIQLPGKHRSPRELNSEECVIWDAVIDAHERDWIQRDQFPVLVQYCKHVITARRVSQMIRAEEAGEEFDTDAYLKLLAAQERESRAVTALARSLRITNQSRYHSDGAGPRPKPPFKKTWE